MIIKKQLIAAILAPLTSLLIFSSANAQAQNPVEAKNGGRWTAGVGVYGVSSPYDKNTDTGGAFPIIAFENDWISIDPSQLAIRAIHGETCKLEAVAAPRWMLSEPADVDRYDDIDRVLGLDLGARASCASKTGFVGSLTYKADVTSISKGHELDLNIAKYIPVTDKFGLNLKGGSYWRDNDLSQYMYGVFGDEALLGRPSYAPGDTLVPYASVAASYRLTKNVIAIANIESEIYTDKIIDSPIIDRKAIGTGIFSLIYNFD